MTDNRTATRVVVIGGDAAGMSAASVAKRRVGDDVDVVVFERGERTSYAMCGLPYFVAGMVPDADALVARTPEQHRANGIDVRTGHEVRAIDLAGDPLVKPVTLDREKHRKLRLKLDAADLVEIGVARRPEVPRQSDPRAPRGIAVHRGPGGRTIPRSGCCSPARPTSPRSAPIDPPPPGRARAGTAPGRSPRPRRSRRRSRR